MQQLGRGFTPSSKDVAIFDFVGNNCSLKIISKHIGQASSAKNSGANEDETAPSTQFIVYDYATPVVEVINDIRALMNGSWTEEEIDILRTHYPNEGKEVASRLQKCERESPRIHSWDESELLRIFCVLY